MKPIACSMGETPRRLRICVLQSSYAEVDNTKDQIPTATCDPDCTPPDYDKEGKYEWILASIKKSSTVSQIRELSLQRIDVFLNLCDGAYDEPRAGMEVVEVLERYNCAYTGADRNFYEPSKELMKKMAHYYSVPTSPWTFIYEIDMLDDVAAAAQVSEAAEGLTYPLIVKHHNGYASVGMGRDSKVSNTAELVRQVRKFVREYGGALVEQFISGREFTVLVAENCSDPESPITFEPVECRFTNGEEFKHFDLKWIDYESMQWVPMKEEEEELRNKLKDAARTAFIALRGVSYGRCDFRVDAEGNVFFLEINPNCGIFYPPNAMGSADYILALDPSTSHAAFIDHILEAAQSRWHKKNQAMTTEVRHKVSSGYGLYASRDLPEGSVVVKYEERDHVLVTKSYARRNYPEGSLQWRWFQEYAYGLTDEVWVSWSEDPNKWLPLNHSCDPNTWLSGLDLVARRSIPKGEQITCDYACFNTENMQTFDCKCASANCRGQVTGKDYLQARLAEMYEGHMSDYVSRRRSAILSSVRD